MITLKSIGRKHIVTFNKERFEFDSFHDAFQFIAKLHKGVGRNEN